MPSTLVVVRATTSPRAWMTMVTFEPAAGLSGQGRSFVTTGHCGPRWTRPAIPDCSRVASEPPCSPQLARNETATATATTAQTRTGNETSRSGPQFHQGHARDGDDTDAAREMGYRGPDPEVWGSSSDSDRPPPSVPSRACRRTRFATPMNGATAQGSGVRAQASAFRRGSHEVGGVRSRDDHCMGRHCRTNLVTVGVLGWRGFRTSAWFALAPALISPASWWVGATVAGTD